MNKKQYILFSLLLVLLTSCFNKSKIEIISKQDAVIIINGKEYHDKDFIWLKNDTDVQYEYKKEHYDSIKKTITITPDKSYIREDLILSKVNLVVNVNHNNVELLLDGKKINNNTKIKPGKYELKVVSDKYKQYKKVLNIEAGEDKVVNINLDKSDYIEIIDKYYLHKFTPFRFISKPEASAKNIGVINPFEYGKVIGIQKNKGFYHVDVNNQIGWISDFTSDELLDWDDVVSVNDQLKTSHEQLQQTKTYDNKGSITESYILNNYFGELHRRYGVSWHFLENNTFYIYDSEKSGVPGTDYGIWNITNGYLITQFLEIEYDTLNIIKSKPIVWQASSNIEQPYSQEFLSSNDKQYKTMVKADLELNKQFEINDHVLEPVYTAVKLKKNTSFYKEPNEHGELFIFEDHYEGDKNYKTFGEQIYILGRTNINNENWLYIDVLTDNWLAIYYINYAWIKESELEYTQSKQLNNVNEKNPYKLEIKF